MNVFISFKNLLFYKHLILLFETVNATIFEDKGYRERQSEYIIKRVTGLNDWRQEKQVVRS